MRVLLASSPGGVLLDLLALKPWWSRHQRTWAAVWALDSAEALADEHVHWTGETSLRRPGAVATGLVRAWRILRSQKPEVVMSAGAGCAVPFFAVATVLGIPTVWLSTFNVLTTPGISGAVCGKLASLVLVQRPATLSIYPHGMVIGELL